MEFIETVGKYWHVIIGFIALGASYVTLRSQNQNQEKRLSTLEGRVESFNPIFLQIQKDLVAIQVSLKFMEQKLDSIEKHQQ